MASPGDIIAERYQVDTLLGEGGLAQVWRVKHCELGSTHALKLLIFRRPRLAERLILEGRIQAQLRHPHIVSVTDVIRHEGQVGLLMEYIDGVALDIYLDDHGPLDVDLAMDLFASILSGVHAAHEAGVLHRDLKPANIMLAKGHGGVIPKVMDFGIAKVVEGDTDMRSTRVGAVMGTPGYLAPEQAEDASQVDQRADVFALGTILYEVLSGVGAFSRAEVDDTSRKADPLESIRPDVPEHICRTIDAAMATRPEDRIATCLEFAELLFADRPELLLRVKGVSTPLTPSLSLSISTNDSFGEPAGATLAPVSTNVPPASLAFDAPQVPSSSSDQRWLPAVVGLFVGVVSVLVWSQQQPAPSAPPPEEVRDIVPADAEPPVARAQTPAPSDEADPVEATPAETPSRDGTQAAPAETVSTEAADDASTTGTEVRAADEATTEAAATNETTTNETTTNEAAKEETTAEENTADDATTEDAVAAIEVPVPASDEAIAPVPQPVEDPAEEARVAETPDAETPDAASPDAAPQEAPEVQLPDIRGQWEGAAQGRPFRLRIDTQQQQDITAEVIFFLGATQRAHRMVGTLDASGNLRLREQAGTLQIEAQVNGTSAAGTYARAGQRKPIPWTASWSAQ
jgi:serine/threonine-protein kinase